MRTLALLGVTLLACSPPTAATDGKGGQTPPQGAAKAPATEKKAQARVVKLLTVQPAAFVETFEVTGKLTAPRDVMVAARGAGEVLSVVERGTVVKKGDQIAKVDPALPQAGAAQARASIRLAQAGLSLAQDTLARQKPLYEKQIISGLEFRRLQGQVDQARAQLAQARAAAQQASTQVRYTEVLAPFDGVIEERLVERGEQLAPGKPVVRLVDSSVLRVKAGVPERYARDVVKGQTATMDFGTYGLGTRKGTIGFVGQSIDSGTRTFPVEADLDNADGSLKPEMSVRVQLSRATRAAALVVPQTAVLRDVDGDSIFVAEGQSAQGEAPARLVARRRGVELGRSSDGQVEVLKGLKAGDRVIVRGQASLGTGDLVKPDVDTPRIEVQIKLEGLAPAEVEAQLTQPMEVRLKSVPGVAKLRSTSKPGEASVIAEFDPQIDEAEARTRIKAAMLDVTLPDGATRKLEGGR